MSKKNRGILATTAVVAAMTLGFKLLGFVKQAVVAYYFGTTFETDIYKASREVKKMQKLSSNILSIWNEPLNNMIE